MEPSALLPAVLLASTSPYRRDLLARLRLPFEAVAPAVDETPRPGEVPAALALRLAIDKAAAVGARSPKACVIGSDQVAELDGAALGKPGDRAGAIAQLRAMSGSTLRFHTAVCVRCGDWHGEAVDHTTVRMRSLAQTEIERYVDTEQPFDCAGSFKCEGLGIALFEAITNDDPTALQGLPLIATARLLREAGLALP